MKISKEDVVEMILNGKTNEELMNILGYDKYSSFKSYLFRNKIKIGELRGKNIVKKIFKNEIFEDGELFYYFAGLVASDGVLDVDRKRIRIGLKSEDAELLDNLSERFFTNGKLYNSINNNSTNVVSFHVENKIIYDKLICMGITPQKTKTLSIDFSKIREDMRNHFLRGYFDGDGSIFFLKRDNAYNSAYCGGTNTMLAFQSILLSHGIVSHIYEDSRKSFSFSNLKMYKKQTILLEEFLYKNSTIWMKRKRDLFVMASRGEK